MKARFRNFALGHLAQRLLQERSGVAATEFAFLLPLMLLLYFGVTEIAEGVMVNRKVSQLTRTLADLGSQVAMVSDSERDNIFNAAETVMAPYTAVAPQMVITSVVIDDRGNATACWSEARNGATALSRGMTITDLPENMRIPNSSVIMARANYRYTPAIGHAITGTIAIGGNPIFMRPRMGRTGGRNNIEQVERDGRQLCPI